MIRLGPIIILGAAEATDLVVQATAGDAYRMAAAEAFQVNAGLQAACQAADAYLHGRYQRLDAEQQALCGQIVDACSAAYDATLGRTAARPTQPALTPAGRQRILDRILAGLPDQP